ncbi:MAG: DUF6046 domain-containing protein [Muribaculaceae bacterium]|nr:DUF6046 domain-containing protein [Muribaculaceae bacterium]
MSIITQPSLGGTKLPISIDLAAVSWAQHLAKGLVRFRELGGSPERDGISGREVGQPITDAGYWEGRWVLCPLRLERENGEGLTFADAVASASREHRIVSTGLVGRDGTVKEYINAGDWVVNIVVGLQHMEGGVIADEWPETEVREVRRLLGSGESLRVHSEFLDALNIGRLVVRSYGVRQMTEGNYQVVEVSAVSDEDYELFSNDYEHPRKEATR